MDEVLVGVSHVLQVIGFNLPGNRNNFMSAGLAQFEDFRYLVEKDIRDMANEFGKRTQAAGKIIFGIGRTKKLVGVMHWVQDFTRLVMCPITSILTMQPYLKHSAV